MHFNSSSWCDMIYSNNLLNLLSITVPCKAATKINVSKKEKEITFFFFLTVVEQATGALMVIDAVSKLQSVNSEQFPGKLKHGSHLSSTSGLSNPTSAQAGCPGATKHPGRELPSLQRSCTLGVCCT